MYLGIDLGTSSVKAIIIDVDQNVVASSSHLTVSHPQLGWSEQNPDDWILAVEECLDKLKSQYAGALSKIRGIGLSGQMHGATLIDRQNHPLRPCILWNDTRSHQEADDMNSDPDFQTITGNLVFPGFTAPKLAWIRKNEPEIFDSIHKILLPKDSLRLWLTGEYVSDMSDSAGTSWLDVEKRCWSEKLLEKTGLKLEHMPKLVEGTDISGRLKPEHAKRWGMPENVVLAGGAGDNAASACGVGTVRPRTAFISIGTSGVIFTHTKEYRPNIEKGVHTFCHALSNSWHQMGVMLSATDSLNWLAKIACTSPDQLTSELGTDLKAPSSVIFLPYLSGERTPHNDARIRGSFVGLSHQTDRVVLTQSVLEGVAFAFRDCFEALQESNIEKIEKIIAIGGGSKSIYWLKIIATVLGVPIDVPIEGSDQGAAFGAARLGLIASESADPYEVCIPPKIGTVIEPNQNLKSKYEENYQKFRTLYSIIRSATT